MVPRNGTFSSEDARSFNCLEFDVSLPTSCFEIVHFAFRDSVPLPQQIESMRALGQWAARQHGFLARQSYHDPQTGRWTDVVEWKSAAEAHAAMERSQHEESLTEVMALIDPQGLQLGHFERLV